MEREPYRWARTSTPEGTDRIEIGGRCEEVYLRQRIRALHDEARTRGSGVVRASAIVAAIDHARGRVGIAHLGDARVYLYRPAPMTVELPVPLAPTFSPEVSLANGSGMVCLTWDHSTACELVEMSLLSRDAGRLRARRRVLTRSLGQEPPPKPDLIFVDLHPGDRLLLCSVGLWLSVDDGDMADVLANASDADAACTALVEAARDGGNEHPITGVVVDWSGADAGDRARSDNGRSAPQAMSDDETKPMRTPGSLLQRFGRDLSALASRNPVKIAGRKDELRAIMRALMRMQKPNVMLVGDPGVGKTWLVEALATVLTTPACPAALQDAHIVELSMGSLLSGARYRGDFEERIENILAEAAADPDLILFLDEIHLAIGAGAGSEGSVDAANLLKPALARGEIRLIGATTSREFDRHIANDDAFLRRFEVLRIEEPSRDESITILTAAAPALQEHHGIDIGGDAIEAAVDLSLRYLPDRRLPDKALDLIDQACVRSVSRWLSMSFSAGVATPGSGHAVSRVDVAAIVAERCRLPLELVRLEQSERLAQLADLLGDRVLGQTDAIRTIASALQRGYRGLRDPERPIASYLFAGPTGVGKTATARAIAELLFDSDAALLRFDMSEYMEKHSVSRLLGAAPGYVGHEDEGQLIRALRRRPAAVVLFDEIEKAHPDVLQILLQALDAGVVKGGRGGEASFRQCVVILTSNLLAELDQPAKKPIGFGAVADESSKGDDEAALRKRLEAHLRPELIGRIDHVVRFRKLDIEALRGIAERHLQRILERLIAHGTVKAPPAELRTRVLATIKSSRYGGREVERAVEAEVEAWLSDADSATATIEPGAVVLDTLGGRHRSQVAMLMLRGVAPSEVTALIDRVKSRPGAGDLCYLRHAGDGALALFGSAAAALRVATGVSAPRRVLHWGQVTRFDDGTPTGVELDRAMQLARADDDALDGAGVIVTAAAAEHLAEAQRTQLKPRGAIAVGLAMVEVLSAEL